MPRGWMLLLCAYLLGWVPATFAFELLSVMPSIGRRGPIAVVELSAHAVAAMICAAAGWMLLVRAPAAFAAAATATVVGALVSMQSLYWTVLPRNTAPSDRPALAALVCGHALFWLAMIGWYARGRDRD